MTLGPTIGQLRLQDDVGPGLAQDARYLSMAPPQGAVPRPYFLLAAMYRLTCSSSTSSGKAPWLKIAS